MTGELVFLKKKKKRSFRGAWGLDVVFVADINNVDSKALWTYLYFIYTTLLLHHFRFMDFFVFFPEKFYYNRNWFKLCFDFFLTENHQVKNIGLNKQFSTTLTSLIYSTENKRYLNIYQLIEF